ncbi:MAG: hypothetical protein ACOYJK_08010 [Prevotella sp.]|jgi:hypothetical protein
MKQKIRNIASHMAKFIAIVLLACGTQQAKGQEPTRPAKNIMIDNYFNPITPLNKELLPDYDLNHKFTDDKTKPKEDRPNGTPEELMVTFTKVYDHDGTFYENAEADKNDKFNDFCVVQVVGKTAGGWWAKFTVGEILEAIQTEITKRKAACGTEGKAAAGYKTNPVCEMKYILNLDLELLEIDFGGADRKSMTIVDELNKLRQPLATNALVYLPYQEVTEKNDQSEYRYEHLAAPVKNVTIKVQNLYSEYGLALTAGVATPLGDIEIIDKQPFYALWPIDCIGLVDHDDFYDAGVFSKKLAEIYDEDNLRPEDADPYVPVITKSCHYIYKRKDTFPQTGENYTTFVPPFEIPLINGSYYQGDDYLFFLPDGKIYGVTYDEYNHLQAETDEYQPKEKDKVFTAHRMQQSDFINATETGEGTDYKGVANFEPASTELVSQEPLIIQLNPGYTSGEDGVGYIVKIPVWNSAGIRASKGSVYYKMKTLYRSIYTNDESVGKMANSVATNYYDEEANIYKGKREFAPHDCYYNDSFLKWVATSDDTYQPAHSQGTAVKHEMKGTMCGTERRSIEDAAKPSNVIYYVAENNLYSTGNFEAGEQWAQFYPFRAWIETFATDESSAAKGSPLQLAIQAVEDNHTTGITDINGNDDHLLKIEVGSGTLTFTANANRQLAVYDIRGMQVATLRLKAGTPSAVSLQPGIYVAEGKKFVVK